MAKVLILFAHPALEKSRVHAAMVKAVKGLPGVTFHDLYERYPDFDIDVKKEQEILLAHGIIIWQHPFYWYSAPALVKQWMDLVLEHNWAYGSAGRALAGKKIFNAISCGGGREAYSPAGKNRFTIPQLLFPFDQTAFLCRMQYLPPFVVFGTHRLQAPEIEGHAARYRSLVQALAAGGLEGQDWQGVGLMNDLPILQEVKSYS